MTAFEMRISDWSSDVCSSDLFSMGLTEPDAGSNSLEVRTFARRDGNGWRVNGRKIWITGVPQADKMLIVARTVPVAEAPKRTHGISLFMVDVNRQGLSHRSEEHGEGKERVSTCRYRWAPSNKQKKT